ncbi:MAG TPA: glycosyltransferase family 61 protein [Jatrophihabitantaceae bacterium]|jgi:capsular polysaccharide biosynthesis protein|nr:glycosyltransferase family 61 protein [Jatrophihabitantaceae bacterium]
MVRLPPKLRPLFPYLKPAYVHATRAVSPITVGLSRGRGGLLPTGVAMTMEDAAESSGGRCVTARPVEVLERGEPVGRPEGLAALEPADDGPVGRVAVAELPGGRVLGPHRAVITGANDLVWEISRYFGTSKPRQHPVFLNPFPVPPLEVEGRLGVLASRGDGNYYHFLNDAIPRIGVLEQAREIGSVDRWYVPAGLPFQRELLTMMGLSDDRIVDASAHPHVRAETLVVPGPPAMTEKNPPWVSAFLRDRLMTAPGAPATGTPIYVTRGATGNNRDILNEAAVRSVLTARGFDVIDPGEMSVADQISSFAQAPVIVSAHGAALANLVFAAGGTSLIEIFPAGCVLPDYWRMAAGIPGMTYRYLSDWPTSKRLNRQTAIVTDITVDLAALEALLDGAATS